MRFKRLPRYEFIDSTRRRAAVLRKQAKERESCPLFAEQIAEEQPEVDAVMEARRVAWVEQEARDRQRQADDWRRGRAKMRQYPESIQAALMFYWNNHRWLPGTPVYFLDMMHMYDTGQLDLNAPGMTTRAFTQGVQYA